MDKIKLQTCYLITNKPTTYTQDGLPLEDFEDMAVLTKEEFEKIALGLFNAGANEMEESWLPMGNPKIKYPDFKQYIKQLFEQ